MSLSLFSIILSTDPADTVDKFRLALESKSAFWFDVVKYAGYAVAAGCAMEAPETFVLIKRWWLLKFRDEEKEETIADKKRWIIPLAAAGLLFIVVGIVIETYAEGKVSDIDALLRAHESDKITAAEADAASATRDAGTAKNSSASAVTDAGRANTLALSADKNAVRAEAIAGVVSTKAEDLYRQVTTAKAQLDTVDAKRAELEKSLINLAVCNAPRIIPDWSLRPTISDSTKYTTDPIRPFAGKRAIVEYISSDAEVRRATGSLVSALRNAGWIVENLVPNERIADGVAVQPYFIFHPSRPSAEQLSRDSDTNGNTKDAAKALVDFLLSYNWQAKSAPSRTNEADVPVGGIKVSVGLYPAVTYVSPPGEKEFAAWKMKSDQIREEEMKKEDEEEKAEWKAVNTSASPEQVSSMMASFDSLSAMRKAAADRDVGPCKPLSAPIPTLP